MNERLKELLKELTQARGNPRATAGIAEEALQHVSQDEEPMIWATLQGALGSSLVESVSGRFTRELFAKVLGAYEATLTVYSPDQELALWAQTQRNIGATHLGAVRSGLGDVVTHVEAAIVAYGKALELPISEQDPSLWLRCQEELAGALGTAASWRGPSAMLQSARAYKAALTAVDKERSPINWAMLKLKLGSRLDETGAEEHVEEAIHACNHALQVFQAETQPLAWAQAHLVLGGLYRTRGLGSRDENLERAVESLDRALSIYARKKTPVEWIRAHYHRGSAYLFRMHGDRNENLERALESLQIAIRAIPRDQSPKTWASLLVTLGQVYLERNEGAREENLDSTVSVLEQALEVLAPDPRDLSWVLASRFLGQAYLERKSGNRDENIEKALAALSSVQQKFPTPDDSAAWCASQMNLAYAYLRRTRGTPDHNRSHAIECLEAALAVPQDMWVDAVSWADAQAMLAALYMGISELTHTDENKSRPATIDRVHGPTSLDRDSTGKAQASTPSADQREFQHSTKSKSPDPFDLAGRAKEQADGLQKNLLEGDGPRETDPNWHVPTLLNEEASLLRHHFEQFLQSRNVRSRTPNERSDLERRRWSLFRMVLEHLTEKDEMARRTQALFEEVVQGQQGFVLLLRGFANRAAYYEAATVVHAGGSDMLEIVEKKRLVKQLAPVPVVLISNPVDSVPLELSTPDMDKDALGFRVESGDTWEADVGALISAASFIIVYNPKMTPGLVTEIRLIETLGRLEQTYFHSAEQADEALQTKGGRCRALTKEGIEHIRMSTKGRILQHHALPSPACRWIEGSQRARGNAAVEGLDRWVVRLAENRTALSVDLELDGYFYLLATLALLERIDRLAPALLKLSQVLHTVDEEFLKEAPTLADGYSRFAEELAVWERTSVLGEDGGGSA